MNTRDTLTPEQATAAWTAAYRRSLDEHPDTEIQWEADMWRAWGVDTVATIADALLAHRRANEFEVLGCIDDTKSLDKLLAAVDLPPVLRLCRDEALSLLAALRLVYWSGLREVES